MFPSKMFVKLLLLVTGLLTTGSSSILPTNSVLHSLEAPAAREYFYIGGTYIYDPARGQHIFSNQMYVEKLSPENPCQPYPLVFIHGNGQTGTNWLNKPDGGPGWATFFLKKGYTVYLIDQTQRGRSAWNPQGNTSLSTYTAETIQQRFTAAQNYNLWPQASSHTQWPGSGIMGDPVFDAYYASTVQYVTNTAIQETNMQAAGSQLLKKIGPAVLIAHSQGGLMPWSIADTVPNLVKAIVAIEPTGPPFQNLDISNGLIRPWGLTNIPLTYFPAVTDLIAPLQAMQIQNNVSGLATCYIQAEPARQLINLKHIPTLVETSESSFHILYDDCTFAFLKQASVPAERLKLADVGIHGNGHMQFMEKNSDQIALVLERWIKSKTG